MLSQDVKLYDSHLKTDGVMINFFKCNKTFEKRKLMLQSIINKLPCYFLKSSERFKINVTRMEILFYSIKIRIQYKIEKESKYIRIKI